MTDYIELTKFIKKNVDIDYEDLKIVLSYFKTIKKRKIKFYFHVVKIVKLVIL